MTFFSKFSRKDLGFAVLTGLIAGTLFWRVFAFLGTPEIHGIPWAALIVVLPVLWVLGVLLGYFLGQWLKFFDQFGKFAAIGLTNASVDFGVLNLQIALTGIAGGALYPLLKSVSFICATSSSYIWNKYWTFNAARSHGGFAEFARFFATALVAFVVNVSVASSVVNFIHPMFGMNANQWANMSAVIGSACALVFSFIGFRLAVFRT